MTQLTLFAFPDEPEHFKPSAWARTDKWDDWCLAMICGPRTFWDEDEQDYVPLVSDADLPRQGTFAGLV